MDHEKEQKEKQRYYDNGIIEQNFNLVPNLHDVKSGQNSFLSPQTLDHESDFACSCDFQDPNVGLQVVPSFDNEVFADSLFSNTDYEHSGIHPTQSGTNYQPQKYLEKVCESLAACLPEVEELGADERTDGVSGIRTRGIATGPERRQSDTDSLDVYLKPCVITPTKVEDLYSTLEDEDNIVFQFPTGSESNLQVNHENEGLKDSNVFEIQLCSLSHDEGLNIESSNDRNLIPCHSNDLLEQESLCLTRSLDHSLPCRQPDIEPRILTNNDNPTNIHPVLSTAIEFQEPCECSESNSSQSSSFPPLLLELTTGERRTFPPKLEARGKPANICKNVYDKSMSSNIDKKGHLLTENKDCTSSNKRDRNGFLLRETFEEETQGKRTEIKAFQKNIKTTLAPNQIQLNANINTDGEDAEMRTMNPQKFKRLARYSTSLKKETCRNTTLFKKKCIDESDIEKTAKQEKTSRDDTRMNHNDTEKQRRDQMKTRFESLRQVIPTIERIEKTPKVQILKHAWKYITYLEDEGQTLERNKSIEKDKNQRLLKKLQNTVKILKENSQLI